MVTNRKRITPTGNRIPFHTLHDVVVIAGFIAFDIVDLTAAPWQCGASTVTTAQPAYSVVDQESAMSGTGTP